MKIERGDEETAPRAFARLRDLKMCLELECSAAWWDAELVCPACGGREVSIIETFMNRQPAKRTPRLRVVERVDTVRMLAERIRPAVTR